MRYPAILAVLVLHGCATASRNWAPVARPSAATCTTPDAPASTPWRLVTTPLFTYCVPAAWQSSDGRTWRLGGAVLGWCTSATLTQCPDVTHEVTMEVNVVTPGQLPGPPQATQFGTGCSGQRSADSVGGVWAQLGDWRCQGHHVTEARWVSFALMFVGETDDAATAQLELQIYRTVRFTTAVGH